LCLARLAAGIGFTLPPPNSKQWKGYAGMEVANFGQLVAGSKPLCDININWHLIRLDLQVIKMTKWPKINSSRIASVTYRPPCCW